MKHTHKYVRIKIGKSKRIKFKCAIPGCAHSIEPELVVGRFTVCNICQKEFVMNKEAMQRAFPRCSDCIERKVDAANKDEILLIEDFVKGIM
jgi:hypothetical protein